MDHAVAGRFTSQLIFLSAECATAAAPAARLMRPFLYFWLRAATKQREWLAGLKLTDAVNVMKKERRDTPRRSQGGSDEFYGSAFSKCFDRKSEKKMTK